MVLVEVDPMYGTKTGVLERGSVLKSPIAQPDVLTTVVQLSWSTRLSFQQNLPSHPQYTRTVGSLL